MIVTMLVLFMAAINYLVAAFDRGTLTITFAEFLDAFKVNLLDMTPPFLFVIGLLLALLMVWYRREIKEGYTAFLSKLNEGFIKSFLAKTPSVILKASKAFGVLLAKVLPWLILVIYFVLAIIIVRLLMISNASMTRYLGAFLSGKNTSN